MKVRTTPETLRRHPGTRRVAHRSESPVTASRLLDLDSTAILTLDPGKFNMVLAWFEPEWNNGAATTSWLREMPGRREVIRRNTFPCFLTVPTEQKIALTFILPDR